MLESTEEVSSMWTKTELSFREIKGIYQMMIDKIPVCSVNMSLSNTKTSYELPALPPELPKHYFIMSY